MKKYKSTPALLIFFVLLLLMSKAASQLTSSVRSHLSTKTNYASRLPIPGPHSPAPSIHRTPDPDGYLPKHIWLLARHGTRWPTKDRMDQISRLTRLFKDARNTRDHPWISGWQPPFVHMGTAGGQLHTKGEDEMWSLGQRLNKRFPTLLDTPYLPHRYPVVSSQVHRAAASASAFTSGFFPAVEIHPEGVQKLQLGQGNKSCPVTCRPQAVAISMLPKHKDPLLRFYDMCPAYAQRELWLESWLPSWMLEQWAKLVPALQERLGLTRTMLPVEVEDIWQLCQFEAGVQDLTSQACSLLSESDVRLLEWVDDVNLLESHGYGSPINYRIAAPLLDDLRNSLKDAAHTASASDLGQADKHVRLLFAHCETLVPLASLLGLFKPALLDHLPSTASAEGRVPPPQIARKALVELDAVEDLPLNQREGHFIKAPFERKHPSPPADWRPMIPMDDGRKFRGSFVSPFSANMGFVLYKRQPGGSSAGSSKFCVRLLYNEQVLPIPCSSSNSSREGGAPLDCDLEEFLEWTADAGKPHLFDALCDAAPTA